MAKNVARNEMEWFLIGRFFYIYGERHRSTHPPNRTARKLKNMRDRMNVPEEYEPVLPGKVQEYIAKKKAAAETEGQVIWYQCVDMPNFWSKNGHKSYKQDGVSAVDAVLTNPENEGALMVTFEDNRLFTIQDGTMLPAR